MKIENHLMWTSEVLFGRSAVITDHWVCLWIFLGSSNGFPLLCILDYIGSIMYNPFILQRMADLEEGTGTEASDSQLLETLYSSDLEESVRWALAFLFVCYARDVLIFFNLLREKVVAS